MAYILVTADRADGGVSTPIHTERVDRRDLESDHFSAQLIERLGWALTDAEEAGQELRPR
ncbi:MAG TPA: hypothetical protein VH231_15650 [Solirubrobacteraceae bacterium]|jgi:hypothetical protein|nr:hypothetical protein [Solirubrobacteraceae bacterium]